ncbi:MAG: HDOD domain-containing protein [Gammaproteobacteria bacterium]|nr:HDOD domain-containing protein [Gammaproteobacteria bacterium]MDP2349029.1 HDOD domain-containing protein [Gammaproteobacteria bacterium]
MTVRHTLLARQPIYDGNLNISAYELLFRSDHNNHATVLDGDSATSQVMLNAFNELDISEVVQHYPAYINFTRNLILNPPPFDRNRFVIEVLETIEVDDELIIHLQALKNNGYTIALDDFLYESKWDPVLRIADIVKLDVLALDVKELERHVQLLKPFNVVLLAEKVETHEMFHYCKALGFTLFQGYFLSKPEQISGRKVPANKLVVMNLLAQIQNPNAELSEIAGIIANDPVLSVKLIRLVNSAAFSARREIASLQHAVSLLGLRHVKSWATLLSLSSMSDKPHALSLHTMSRARMCQLVAECFTSPSQSDAYFTTGLLSNLDAFFDMELSQIVTTMPLSQEVVDGLLAGKGNLGLILSSVIANEQARWPDIDWLALKHLNVSENDIEKAYFASLQWAEEMGSTVRNV